MALYQLTEQCYRDDRLHERGESLTLPDDEIPSWYMKPIDDAAKEAKKKAKEYRDPLNEMTSLAPVSIVGGNLDAVISARVELEVERRMFAAEKEAFEKSKADFSERKTSHKTPKQEA